MLARFVFVVLRVRVPLGRSASEESGVLGREGAKDGRRREVRDGEGGSGVGGLL